MIPSRAELFSHIEKRMFEKGLTSDREAVGLIVDYMIEHHVGICLQMSGEYSGRGDEQRMKAMVDAIDRFRAWSH